AGRISLDSVANAMGTVAAKTTAAGAITLIDSDDLIVGSVTAKDTTVVSGIISNGAVADDLKVTTKNGTLTVSKPINAALGDVVLESQTTGATANIVVGDNLTGALVDLKSAGNITETALKVISATNVVARAAGPISLDSVANAMGTVAAKTTAAGAITLIDSDDLIVGSVTAKDTTVVSGIISNGAVADDVKVTTKNGTLTVSKPINAALGDVVLESQTTGATANIVVGDNLTG